MVGGHAIVHRQHRKRGAGREAKQVGTPQPRRSQHEPAAVSVKDRVRTFRDVGGGDHLAVTVRQRDRPHSGCRWKCLGPGTEYTGHCLQAAHALRSHRNPFQCGTDCPADETGKRSRPVGTSSSGPGPHGRQDGPGEGLRISIRTGMVDVVVVGCGLFVGAHRVTDRCGALRWPECCFVPGDPVRARRRQAGWRRAVRSRQRTSGRWVRVAVSW